MLRNEELEGELFSGTWISFRDANGYGYAQTDHYILGEAVLLVECKLTQNTDADGQLRFLYKPLLEHIYKRPVLMVQACKNLRWDPGPLEIQHPRERLEDKRDILLWNFRG